MTKADIDYKTPGFHAKSVCPVKDHQAKIIRRKKQEQDAIQDILAELDDIDISMANPELD